MKVYLIIENLGLIFKTEFEVRYWYVGVEVHIELTLLRI